MDDRQAIEAAKEKAYQTALANRGGLARNVPANRSMFATAFSEGWNAALEYSASRWTAINSEDDLPKEKGFYLTCEPDRNFGDKYGAHLFTPDDLICIRGWRQTFQSWMPIPPYQPQERQEQK